MPTDADPTPDTRIPAGRWWCDQYQGDRTTATLRQPFRRAVQRWITELEQGRTTPRGARCTVRITATARPYLRALLMRRCWEIVKEGKDPDKIPVHPALNIRWTKEGAAEMFRIYGLRARPSLTSRHIVADGVTDLAAEGAQAIDCTIEGWAGTRAELDDWSRERGVYPLAGDPVHWSVDGR